MHRTPRHSVSTTSSNDSSPHLSLWDAVASSPTLPATPPSSVISARSSDATDASDALLFQPPVAVAFTKGASLFKLKFVRVDVCRDAAGGLRHLELSTDAQRRESRFCLRFPSCRTPMPHLEQPYEARAAAAYRVCFLEEEQTLQTGGHLFQARPSLGFERWEDCVRFQEAVMGHTLVFTGGVAEVKSRGRGEECISQNLRVLRARSGERMTIVFFANSQRKEKRRYVSVPVGAVDHVDAGRRGKVTLKLSPDTELLASLKTLQMQFLDEGDAVRLASVLKR